MDMSSLNDISKEHPFVHRVNLLEVCFNTIFSVLLILRKKVVNFISDFDHIQTNILVQLEFRLK